MVKLAKNYMISDKNKYKTLKKKLDLVFWLKERIDKLEFGIKNKVKTDSSTDFEMLKRKLLSYKEEYRYQLNELITSFKLSNETKSLSQQDDCLREESRTISLRRSYF
jgi:hypothetical protein